MINAINKTTVELTLEEIMNDFELNEIESNFWETVGSICVNNGEW